MANYPLPAGVAEQTLVLRTCGLAIPAVLTTPESKPATAALLLIPGSLFCDVNGDFPSWNAFPGTNAWLAGQLAERGIAVYRYAKAGPGTGTVVEDEATWATHRTWPGRVTIARAAVVAMRAALADAGLDVPLIISGHSEGAVIASRLGAEHAAECGAVGYVLLSGPAVGILSVMKERHEREAPADERAMRVALMEELTRAILDGTPVPEAAKTAPWMMGMATMPPEAMTYFAECERTDPCAMAAAIPTPVLVVQGTDDQNVTMHDATRLVAARAGQPTELLELEGLSHMFKRVPVGTNPMMVFGWPGPCEPEVAAGVAAWIGRVVA